MKAIRRIIQWLALSALVLSTISAPVSIARAQIVSYTNWNDLVTNWVQASTPAPYGPYGPYQWNSLALSADGTRLVAAAWSGSVQGSVFTSTNLGATWTQTAQSWAGTVACSADGTRLAAAMQQSGIYISGDSGTSWTETCPLYMIAWSGMASSVSGSTLAAASTYENGNPGVIRVSTNSGATWAVAGTPSPPSWNRQSVACSADGTKLAAAISGVGIYVSGNSGATWAPTSAPTNTSWYSIASSTDGTRLVAATDAVYISTNSGVTWTQTSAIGGRLACSADGTRLVVANANGIYVSGDSGATWIQTSAPAANWLSVASSADGTKLVAGSDNGVWTAQATISQRVLNTWYVWQDSPANGPGAGWGNAFHDIQSAVNAAAAGDTVLVTNGVYDTGGVPAPGHTLTNRVCINTAILLKSVNGPALTAIVGDGSWGGPLESNNVRCVYLGANAVLSGFTVSNGYTRFYQVSDTTEMCGGGIWCPASGVITNCILIGNIAQTWGSGASGGAFFNCILAGNHGNAYGAGAANCALNDCILSNNSSGSSGGGAYQSTLNNCVLTGNYASGYGYGGGGGAASCTLNNCILTNNTAPGPGGGGGASGSTLNHCTLSGNSSSSGYGGGAFNSVLNNCVLAGNSAPAGGEGGGACGGALNNCLISGNSAFYGGGVYGGSLNDCTVVSNTAYDGGGACGGAYFYLPGVFLTNCIVYDNSAPNYPNFNSNSVLSYCCAAPLPPGPGNLAADPQFVNPATGDFHLLGNSPCIDTGNGAYASGATDLDGNLRIFNGTVDMGAYEFHGAPPALTNIVVTPAGTTIGIGATQPFAATGQFADGSAHALTPADGLCWSSSNPAVASIDSSGLATALSAGLATITATSGSVTGNTVLTVVAPPAISANPASTTVNFGGTVTFSANVSGTPPFTYQWLFNGIPLLGATNATLTVTNFSLANIGSYAVTVSNPGGSVTSQPALLASASIQMFAGIVINGPVGSNYLIQATSNLAGTWTTLTNVALPSQPYIFIDYGSTWLSRRFYRALPAQ